MAQPTVFLSHSSEDKPFVRRIATELSAAGYKVWLDETSLEVGDAIVASLAEALAIADYVLAVVSNSSIRSAWFHKEINLALTRETEERRLMVLPVLIDSAPIPSALRDKLYADFRDAATFSDGVMRLLRAMKGGRAEAQQAPSRALVDGVTISKLRPALVILLLDQSGSMAETHVDFAYRSRADVIADIANDLIMDLVTRSLRGVDVVDVVDRFFVAALGYGGEAGKVSSAFDTAVGGGPLYSISELVRGHADGRWVLPRHGADAPMCRAIRHAHRLARDWIAAGHDDGIPPIVFNITDGAATDGDPRIAARNLFELTTKYGSVLLFNCCLSYVGGKPVRYPATADELPDAYARVLFEMSSELTTGMRAALEEVGVETGVGARGLVYQTDPRTILQFLTVGTRGATRRM